MRVSLSLHAFTAGFNLRRNKSLPPALHKLSRPADQKGAGDCPPVSPDLQTKEPEAATAVTATASPRVAISSRHSAPSTNYAICSHHSHLQCSSFVQRFISVSICFLTLFDLDCIFRQWLPWPKRSCHWTSLNDVL